LAPCSALSQRSSVRRPTAQIVARSQLGRVILPRTEGWITSEQQPLSGTAWDPASYELAFREGVRQLEHQESSLDELRSRAGTLLAASSLATSFLGAAALPKGTAWDWPVYLAVAFFAVGIVLCLAVLWPLTEWRFVNSPAKVIDDYIEGQPPASLAETYKDLALHAGQHAQHNGVRLRWLYWSFQGAAICLLVQVVAWLVVLWGGSA
jgi:hypothetical protein